MKFSELIEHAIECIKTFNPVIKTIDSHADDFLKDQKDPYEKVFVKQVFYGCIRYQEFLKIFNNILFKTHSSSTNRNDATLYLIFGYLSFFRLEELAIEDYRKLVLSQDTVKMHAFLQFLFDGEGLRQHVREEWMTLYDYAYIDEKIIGAVEKNLPNVAEIMKTVEKRATGKVSSSLSQSMNADAQETKFNETGGLSHASHLQHQDDTPPKKTPTEQKPFNLTKPKPKVIPQPEALPREIKSNPVPKGLFKKTLADIEKEKEERRKMKVDNVRKQYEGEGTKKRFALASEGRPNKFDKIKEEVTKQRQEELKFDMRHAREMPDFSKKEAPVKLNAAAVVREAHQLKKKEDEEAKILKDFEMNLRDEKEFERWRKEMDEKAEIEKLEHIQKKKIEMEMAREEAIEAQKRKEKENRLVVAKIKEEKEIKFIELEEQIKEEFEKKKEVVEAVLSQKDNALKEMEKVKEEKRKIRDEVNRELTEALQRRKDEEEVERRKKEELIRQIRELERIPIVRTKGFDPTETSGIGLLEEMSIAELRERLEFNKRKQEQETTQKREENLKFKEDQAKSLMDMAGKIHEARDKRKSDNETKKEQKQREKEELEAKMKAARDKGLMEVYDKISKKKKDKKQEEDRLAKELKEIKLQRQYLNANRAMVEEKAWKELEAGAERKVRNAQNQKLIDQCGTNEIKVKDETVRATNAKTQVLDKLEYDKDYQEKLQSKRKENEVIHKSTLEYKSEKHEKQKDFENQLKVAATKRNPFNAKINQQSMANATKYQEKKRLKETQGQQHQMDYGYDETYGGGGMDLEDDGGAHADIESKFAMEH